VVKKIKRPFVAALAIGKASRYEGSQAGLYPSEAIGCSAKQDRREQFPDPSAWLHENGLKCWLRAGQQTSKPIYVLP
jgi:hypothetical protein